MYIQGQNFNELSALTMVGRRRIDHMNALIQDVLHRDIPGDIIELGCWRGGVALFAAAAVAAYEASKPPVWWTKHGDGKNINDRHMAASKHPQGRLVWLADSFDGLPPVDLHHFPGDESHADIGSKGEVLEILRENSVELVARAADALEVTQRVRFLEGYFNDTLPAAIRKGTFGNSTSNLFSILRLDGDLYQSTLESLHYLYPFLSVGGHVVVDDFTDWEGCRQAVLDFRDAHGIESADEGLQVTWHDLRFDPARGEYTRGVWWTKQREVAYDPLDEGRPVFYGDGGMARLPLVAEHPTRKF